MATHSTRRETVSSLLDALTPAEQRSIAALAVSHVTSISETAAAHTIDRLIACKQRGESDTMILLRLNTKRVES